MENQETSKDSSATTSNDKSDQVVKWVLRGVSHSDLLQAATKLFPEEDASALVDVAYAQLARLSVEPAALREAWLLESSRELYRKMVEIGDFPGALRAVKQIADIHLRQEKRSRREALDSK